MRDDGLAPRIARILSLDPARGAIEHGGVWYSWADMASSMKKVQALLDANGLGEGAAVGVIMRNRPHVLFALLGVLLSGRCVVTLNPFQSAQGLARGISELRPPVLIGESEDLAVPAIMAAARETSCLVMATGTKEGVEHLADLNYRPSPSHHEPLPGTGILILSSGTTGPAKRVRLAYRKFERAVLDVAFYEAGSGDGDSLSLKHSVAFGAQPLVHIGGIWTLMANLAVGRAVVLFEKFDVSGWHEAVLRHRPKLVSLPPAALRMIYDAEIPREDFSSFIAFRSGSAPLDPVFVEAFEQRYGVPILDSYGATEFGGGVAGWTWQDHKAYGKHKRGSVGRANEGCSLRVVDTGTGSELPVGTVGLLEVKTPQIGSEWVRTTDLAQLDEDGFLYIRGRADDAIIRGGFKVLPQEVVDVLKAYPGVRDVGVVGLPDQRLGAIPVAAVELVDGVYPPSEEELRNFARQHLVAYQVPARIKVVDELPRTPSMKVSQPGIRELFEGQGGVA